MRPRIRNLPILVPKPLRPPNSFRLFTHIRSSPTRARPQLAFLPTYHARRSVRFLTTREFIKETVIISTRSLGAVVGIWALLTLFIFGVGNEYFERCCPTPPEWTYISRMYLRKHIWLSENDGPPEWYPIGRKARELIKRLEDPKIDGVDVKKLEGEDTGFDVTAKSVAWRQGYFAALMLTAKAAEYLEEWVLDTSRKNIPFMANTVIGPSNPRRKPIPLKSPPPALEENCIKAFESPDIYYKKLITTQGFTPKQRLEARLAYASWLDYKGRNSEASELYNEALETALSTTPYATNPSQILDPKTKVLKAGVGSDSVTVNSNVLRATTEMALHEARTGSTSSALPMFLSILRARRSLPTPPDTMRSSMIPDKIPQMDAIDAVRGFVEKAIRFLFVVPKYPIDPDDGTGPLLRDPREKCEEAALMTYVGEILYASPSASSEKAVMTARENGLAWTREAVDIAEESLVYILQSTADKKARNTCKECLETGLDNWAQMIRILVENEKMKAEENEKSKSWFGGRRNHEMIGRWESEDVVVKERIKRARFILSSMEKEPSEQEYEWNKKAFGGFCRGWLMN